MKRKLYLVKLGGSLITNKKVPFKARPSVIERLGREIKTAMTREKADLVIAHGSGSFGHTYASKYLTHQGIVNKNSLKGLVLTADVAARINRIVLKGMIASSLKAVSFAPASLIIAKGGKSNKVFLAPIKKSIELGLVPVVYGDIIFDSEKGFCIFSGEKILNLIAKELKGNYNSVEIVYCTDTDGVYDKSGRTVRRIDKDKYNEIKTEITGSKGYDVTGGMLHKVEESLKLAGKSGIKTLIVNGRRSGNLRKVLLGEKVVSTIIR